MRIYIAGPMSGIEGYNRPEFTRVAGRLERDGHVILNPGVLPLGLTEPQYMDIAFAMLRACDAVMLLKGWQQSAGATAEYHYAYKVGLKIMTELQLLQGSNISADWDRGPKS